MQNVIYSKKTGMVLALSKFILKDIKFSGKGKNRQVSFVVDGEDQERFIDSLSNTIQIKSKRKTSEPVVLREGSRFELIIDDSFNGFSEVILS